MLAFAYCSFSAHKLNLLKKDRGTQLACSRPKGRTKMLLVIPQQLALQAILDRSVVPDNAYKAGKALYYCMHRASYLHARMHAIRNRTSNFKTIIKAAMICFFMFLIGHQSTLDDHCRRSWLYKLRERVCADTSDIYMGGKQSCACFGTSRVRESEVDWEPRSTKKIRPSDDDRGYFWFSEPDVDNKASDFIARFHASRYTEADQQAIRV
ncbi:hypothetical protein ZIOFF_067192 [Zingiber officinale]|uniref:Uncharacterized protein n=1 Tax=Zingiber officinale TaxID=94328 RepID=A0A8J5BJF9_ZINOF|nr:hypothetical protein ZIOFF_067192 [Zingiber officinale]